MMDVTDTVAANLDDYVTTAVALGRDAGRRAALKRRVAESKHRLYRDRAAIAALEDLLETAARGERPVNTGPV
jgi:predicted O-linked N-acetylglucosamine transferase (SPINDLY family)